MNMRAGHACTLWLLVHVVSTGSVEVLRESCQQKEDGSRCFKHEWQKEGVCEYSQSDGIERCIAPASRNFQFRIIARYQRSGIRSINLGPRVTNMYIRGFGPGLTWERSLSMKRSAQSIEEWSATITYTVSSDGLACLQPVQCTLNQRAIEFRIYQDELGEKPMKGPNFYFPLPITNSMAGSQDFRTPTIYVYPWFNMEQVMPRSFEHALPHRFFSRQIKIRCTLLLPPSFHENIRKTYPLVVLFGSSNKYRPLLEQLMVHEASIEEIMVAMVMVDDWKMLLPYNTHHLRCLVPRKCDDCFSCWASSRAEPCDKEEFKTRSRRCLLLDHAQGHGEAFLEALYQELPPAVQERTRNRVKFAPPSERLTLVADTTAAVAILDTAIQNPDKVGNVACFSPKLFLPLSKAYTADKHILKTIKRHGGLAESDLGAQALYSTQKYYLDQGENDDFFFPIAESFETATTVISDLKSSLYLKDDVNIIFHVIPQEPAIDYLHNTPPNVLSRLKYPLQYFFKAQGGANQDYTRSLVLDEAFLVDQQSRLAHTSLQNTNGSKSVLHGFSQATEDCIPQPCNMVEVPLLVYLGSIGKIRKSKRVLL